MTQYKITRPVLDAWCRILREAPTARLLVANTALGSRWNREYLLEQLGERGVPRERVELLGPAGHMDFLRYYDRIDVALDAFPYSGGTTTMEAIWQGVPVLTLEGDRWASRTSRSLLRSCHRGDLGDMGDWVAPDVDGYVAAAVALAANPETPERLRHLRLHMREELCAAPVCDTRSLARHMEALYREIAGS